VTGYPRFRPRFRPAAVFAVAIAGLALAPRLTGPAGLSTLFYLVLYAGLAQSWNLASGFGGQASLGHAAFLGAGAYAASIAMLHGGLPVSAALVAAALAGALFAAVAAVALLRLRGVYFAVGSLALATAVLGLATIWNYTGASQGMSLPLSAVPGPDAVYYLAAALALAATAVAWLITRTRAGVRMMAVRDDEDAAAGLGVNTRDVRILAMTVSGAFTGLFGAVIALNQVVVTPDNVFGMNWTVSMLVMTIVGGIGTVVGPLAGAFVVYYLIQQQLLNYPTLSAVLSGVLLIAVVKFTRDGIWGALCDGARRIPRALPRSQSKEAV
jgi:branched-chain amino acid transport system permease protein